MPEYLAPGVYVEEFDSGIKAMEGVGTSTGGFIGMAEKGPTAGKPVLLTSFADYQRKFGTYLPERIYGSTRYLPYAVEQFFANGGSSCYVMRVEPLSSAAAMGNLGFINVTAKNAGSWGNNINFVLRKSIRDKSEILSSAGNIYELKKSDNISIGDLVCLETTVIKGDEIRIGKVSEAADGKLTLEWELKVSDDNIKKLMSVMEMDVLIDAGATSEYYEKVSFNPNASNYIIHKLAKSEIVKVEMKIDELKSGIMEPLLKKEEDMEIIILSFTGGSDGAPSDYQKISKLVDKYKGDGAIPGKRTGLSAFLEINDVNIMAMPGITEAALQLELVSHCENLKDRFAVLDIPGDYRTVDELSSHKESFDTNYAAIYHPWIECYDATTKKAEYFPPSGAVIGIYARTDIQRGVHKAPANEIVKNCTGLSVSYNEAEQGKLNPKGINLIRALPGQGIRVWGARTCSSDGNWKYVNVRRLFIYIEESIKKNTNWAVFEPNDAVLWSRVEGTIKVFLTTLWRNGALMGSSPDAAFYVSVGNTTMTSDDILNGRLICEIGVAPVRPAEFVIFRITQKMQDAL